MIKRKILQRLNPYNPRAKLLREEIILSLPKP
jgi:hypothetical protein